MKILSIHNYHRSGSASGDDVVFQKEAALLRKNGIEVVTYSVSNDEFDKANVFGKVFATLGMQWSQKNYREVKRIIRAEKPDLVHVHTFFPLLSPSILYAAKRCGVKVVATLHDTRFVCPNANSLREGRICNLCGDGRYMRMCKYRCFKGSRLQSFIVANVFRYHRFRKTFYNKIDKYICLNDSQMSLLEGVGFDRNKMVKKYNFVEDTPIEALRTERLCEPLPERFVVYYGRLGQEKGISQLMEAWEQLPEIPLVVMGGGPLLEEFLSWAQKHPQVHYMGYVPRSQCLAIVKQSEFVVFPSIWYEGCSMVEIETKRCGRAIIANDIGFSSEAIIEGVNGLKVPLNDADIFAQKIQQLWKDSELIRQMGDNSRLDYERKYTPQQNIEQLIRIYEEMLK